MEKRHPHAESTKTIGRDKIEMAWRHKSRGEKNLLKVIAFLVFALLCFIIAVIAMDITYKAKINDLEDEIHDLKSTSPATTLSTTTEEQSTTTGSSSTTVTPSITTTHPTTTSASTDTQTSTLTTSTDTEGTTTSKTTPETTTQNAIFDALRAMLFNFSGMTSTKSLEQISHRGTITSRSRGTFLIMADINHEESNSVTPQPDSLLSDTEQGTPIVYIDNNGTKDENGTAIFRPVSHFDDTEEDYEATTGVIDDLELMANQEGSGTSSDEDVPH